MRDYLSSEDAILLTQLKNMSSTIMAAPAAYATSSSVAADFVSLVSEYDTAFLTATADGTRTKGTILVKDEKRALAVAFARQLVRLIKPNEAVTDQAKVDAGIPLPRTGAGAPRPAPHTSPALTIVGNTPGAQTLTYRDSIDSARRAKPYGCTQLQVFMAVGEAAAGDVSQANWQGSYTRGPIGIAFNAADNQKVATYWARWGNAKGQFGPWSNPVSMTIAA